MPSRASSLPWSRFRSNSRPLPTHPVVILDEKDGFGIPAFGDPDPFGVLALEREGLEIKEAGTKHRPSSDAFDYRPSPTSPIFSTFARRSIDGISRRSSRRESKFSVISLDRATQTADLPPPIDEVLQNSGVDLVKRQTEELPTLDEDGDDEMEQETRVGVDEVEEVEEPDVIIEEASAAVHIASQTPTSPIVSRARLVTIPKRIPPALPPRSPYRKASSKAMTPELVSDSASIETASDHDMSSRHSSPLRNEFFAEYAGDGGNPWDEHTASPDAMTEEVSISMKKCYLDEEKAVNENDEFHSLPGSPIESLAPVL